MQGEAAGDALDVPAGDRRDDEAHGHRDLGGRRQSGREPAGENLRVAILSTPRFLGALVAVPQRMETLDLVRGLP